VKLRSSWNLVVLFCLPFCGVGIATGVLAVREMLSPAPRLPLAGFLGLFCVTFGTAGFGLIALTRGAARLERQAGLLRESNPGAPWRWREDWAAGRAEPSTRKWGVVFIWVFAVLWILITCPTVFLVPAEIRKGNSLAAIGLILPLIGIGMLISALRQTLLWNKFGVSAFEMATVPFAPGGRLAGAILTGLELHPEGGFHLRLTCVNRTVTGAGSNRSVDEKILWREERTMTRPLPSDDPARTRIPVSFVLPADARETSTESPGDQVRWILDADAKVPGLDYHAEFELPVFGAAVAAATPDPMAEFEAPEASGPPGPETGILVRPAAGGGTEIYYRALRNPGPATAFAIVLAIWSAVEWLLIRPTVPLIIPILSGAFELLFLVLAADLWFGTTRIEIEAGRIAIRNRILGIGPTSILPASALREVKLSIGMQTGGHEGTPYYSLKLIDADDRGYSGGRYIADKRAAEWVASEIRRLAKS
jgi:hypothetical protein